MGVLLATGVVRGAGAGASRNDAGWPDAHAPVPGPRVAGSRDALAALSTPRLAAALSARLRDAFRRFVDHPRPDIPTAPEPGWERRKATEPSIKSDPAEVV